LKFTLPLFGRNNSVVQMKNPGITVKEGSGLKSSLEVRKTMELQMQRYRRETSSGLDME